MKKILFWFKIVNEQVFHKVCIIKKLLSNIAGFLWTLQMVLKGQNIGLIIWKGIVDYGFFLRLTANSSKNKNLNGYSFSEELYKTQVCNLFF